MSALLPLSITGHIYGPRLFSPRGVSVSTVPASVAARECLCVCTRLPRMQHFAPDACIRCHLFISIPAASWASIAFDRSRGYPKFSQDDTFFCDTPHRRNPPPSQQEMQSSSKISIISWGSLDAPSVAVGTLPTPLIRLQSPGSTQQCSQWCVSTPYTQTDITNGKG